MQCREGGFDTRIIAGIGALAECVGRVGAVNDLNGGSLTFIKRRFINGDSGDVRRYGGNVRPEGADVNALAVGHNHEWESMDWWVGNPGERFKAQFHRVGGKIVADNVVGRNHG